MTGKQLQRWRTSAGLRVEAVAAEANVTERTVRRWEARSGKLPEKILRQIRTASKVLKAPL